MHPTADGFMKWQDGLSLEGTLVSAMEGKQSLDSVVQTTKFDNLSFIASSQRLEDLGRQITDMENYATVCTGLMASRTLPMEFVVIDSQNQISPGMENAIYPSESLSCRLKAPRRYVPKPISSNSSCDFVLGRNTAYSTPYPISPASGDSGNESLRRPISIASASPARESIPAAGWPRWMRTGVLG